MIQLLPDGTFLRHRRFPENDGEMTREAKRTDTSSAATLQLIHSRILRSRRGASGDYAIMQPG